MRKYHFLVSCTLLLLPLYSFSQDITLNKRVYTPKEGRIMSSSYGFVSSLQGIIKLTVSHCAKWLPEKNQEFTELYPLWLERNKYYLDKNSKIYSDLLLLVSKSAAKKKKEIDLLYKGMTMTAVKRYKTILFRKSLDTRNQFCNIFIARLAAGILDIKSNKPVSEFLNKYIPLSE